MLMAHIGAPPQQTLTTVSPTTKATRSTRITVPTTPSPGSGYIWVGDHWERPQDGASATVRETPAEQQPENRVVIGPFEFYAKGSRLAFHGSRQELVNLPPAWAEYLKTAVDDMSRKALLSRATLPRTIKGWGTVEPRVAAGKIPIAKATNPIEGGDWGIYVKIEDNRILWMEYKPIPRDWFDKLGAALLAIPKAIIEAARKLCGVTQNDVAQLVMAASDSKPVKTAQELCQIFFGSEEAALPDTSEMLPDTTDMLPDTTELLPLAERLPDGSIQTQLPDGRWAYAIPRGAQINGALGSYIPPRYPFRERCSNWYDIKTADSPYLATWGIAQPFEEVGVGDQQSTIAEIVDQKTFKDKTTTPFYKKWWFWAAIGGVTVTGVGYYTYRRRK